MTQALIPNPLIRWHFKEIQKKGFSEEEVCQQFDVPKSVFLHDGNDVSAESFAEMIKQSVHAIKDESYGAINNGLPIGSFRMMTYACITCITLKQAIYRLCDYYRLFSDQINWHLKIEEKSCKLVFDTDTQSNHDYFIIYTSCIIWRWLSWMIDMPIKLEKFNVSFPSPNTSAYLPGVYKTHINYDAGENALYFDNALLNSPIKQTAQSLQTFLINAPECLLAHYHSSLSLTKKVKDYLEILDNLSEVNLLQTAEYFHCSEQSLIRGLKLEGTRFKDIREKVKKQKAAYYLVKTAQTNQQISALLGFSEVSVFYRNFKKWFGVTPSKYRADPSRAVIEKL